MAASIKFPETEVIFKHKGGDITLHVNEKGHTISLVSHDSFDKAIKSFIFAYIIFVRDAPNSADVSPNGSSKVDNDLHSFLNEHAEIFIDDISSELPPKWGFDDHMIDLILGSSPLNKPPYRVSQAQQEEIMLHVNELVQKGASNHMTNHGEWFKELQALQNLGYVETGNDTAHSIVHTGNMPLSLQDGNVKYLADVLHVPNITKNLVFVGQMVEQGLQVRFNADGLYVEEYKKNGKLIAQGKKVRRMFTLDVNIPEVNAVMFVHGSSVVADIEIWHKRSGHANMQRLKTMQSQELVTCLHVFKVADMQKVCEACQFGKQAKASFLHDKHVSRNVLELVLSDVWGPAKTASMSGCRFYVTFIDDHTCKVWVYFMKYTHTRKVWVYFMKEKSEEFTHFQNFKAMAEKQTRKYVQCVRSDGGGEYFSNEFSSFLKRHGIQRQFTCKYTP
ncbi:hypothetical protein L7F22_012129 [Adiantum nelumboides]|nr:hypothetical protein [Adiantum nelumboides]